MSDNPPSLTALIVVDVQRAFDEWEAAGKPGQHHVAKSQCGGLTPRRNVLRQAVLQRRRDRPSL